MEDRDLAVCGALNHMSRPPKIKKFFVVVSWLGMARFGTYYVALPLLYGDKGLRHLGVMVQVGFLNFTLYRMIKRVGGRARPCAVSDGHYVGHSAARQYSFPSGHTMHAVAFSLVVIAHHPEFAGVLMAFSSSSPLPGSVLGLHIRRISTAVDRRIRGFGLVDAVNSLTKRFFYRTIFHGHPRRFTASDAENFSAGITIPREILFGLNNL